MPVLDFVGDMPSRVLWQALRNAAGFSAGFTSTSIGALLDEFYRSIEKPIPKSFREISVEYEEYDAYYDKLSAWQKSWPLKVAAMSARQKEDNNEWQARFMPRLFLASTEYMEKVCRKRDLGHFITYGGTNLRDAEGEGARQRRIRVRTWQYGQGDWALDREKTPLKALVGQLNQIRQISATALVQLGLEARILDRLPGERRFIEWAQQVSWGKRAWRTFKASTWRQRVTESAVPSDSLVLNGKTVTISRLWDTFLEKLSSAKNWETDKGERVRLRNDRSFKKTVIQLHLAITHYEARLKEMPNWGQNSASNFIQHSLNIMREGCSKVAESFKWQGDLRAA